MIRILHIDDNPDDLELSKVLFTHLSDEVSVSVASSASEAAASISEQEFDCIICDYNLPDVDGLSFLQNLRQAGDKTPFIFLTGQGNEEVAATALRSGADDYYVKKAGTSSYRVLLARIKKLNEAKQAAQRTQREGQATTLNVDSFFSAATDSMREAVFVLDDHDYTVRYCNRAVETLFGFSREELLNTTMERLILSKIVYQDLLRSLSSQNGGMVQHIQLSMRTRNNDIIIADVTASQFATANGSGTGVTIVARDDSRNRVREIALRDHINALEQRVHELDGVKKEFESFIYTVSHDLKGHVNNIVEFSKIIEDDYSTLKPEDIRRFIGIIHNTGHNLKSMLDGLLNLSRATSAELEMKEVNLTTIARSVIDELRSTEPERSAKIHIEDAMVVQGDESLLRSAITNLLNNAWKYTATRQQAEITFSFMVESNKRIFFVEDNGIGFSDEHKDKLFQPFQRLHDNRQFPGTGLGLAIVERVIHRHGGSIWAESEEDEGTSFFFTLS
jgi:PAS domain S-box-containing protein